MSGFRQYDPWECGPDGYPFAWHGKCACDELGVSAGALCMYEVCSNNALKDQIREQAHNRCERCLHPYAKGAGEWSLCDERCRHGSPIKYRSSPAYGIQTLAQYRILTVHHLDEDKTNCRWWNLVALCQRCHLRMQRKVVMDTPYHYEHSEWFKPYAAAFYAFKYLGEDLTRTQVMSRQDELLKLEHRFTQGSLL